MAPIEAVAFPRLTSTELALVKPLATPCDYADGETIFRAGQADIDLYPVESGQIAIRNPTDGDRLIRRTLGPGMSEYLSQRIQATANVVVHEQTEIAAIHGNRHMEAIALRNDATKLERRVPCSAVFVFIGAEPAAAWLPAAIARDANGYVLTGTDVVRSGLWPRGDRDPCPLETTVPGILAAGDIRSGSTKRVGFAVGDGSLAVTCAHRLLSISR